MSIRVAILTVSDSAVSGARADASGPALREECLAMGWTVTAEALVADEVGLIAQAITSWADTRAADVIFSTGGTGIAPRDVTPEATRSVVEREISGLAELLRTRGLEQTKFSVLSRGIVGSRGQTLIANLPGSPSGAVFSLRAIAELMPHVVQLLHGETGH